VDEICGDAARGAREDAVGWRAWRLSVTREHKVRQKQLLKEGRSLSRQERIAAKFGAQ
jgi:hypothetical protein